jgi:P-type Cu2+ transporter
MSNKEAPYTILRAYNERTMFLKIQALFREVTVENHEQHTAPDRSNDDQTKAHDHSQHGQMDHSKHTGDNHATHNAHQGHDMATMPKEAHSAHASHGTDHAGHEQMFRDRFWWSLLLSIPVLLYSGMIQMWLGFTPPAFPFNTARFSF